MLLLEVEHVGFVARRRTRILGREKSRVILEDVSLTLAAGEALALLGESGGGKTTLARCISGIQTASSGTVRIAGKEISQWEGSLPVQMLFQNHTASLDPMMSVREILQEGFEATGLTASDSECAQALEEVGLQPKLQERFPGQLSGGERQRVALARVLAARPQLLVADEPTSSLDRLNAESLLLLLHSVTTQRGIALLHVTHDLLAASRTSQRAVIMHGGRIVEHGDWQTLRNSAVHSATRTLMSAAERSGF